MSKRVDAIRSMFAAGGETLSADNAAPRAEAGSVRSIKTSLSGVERENAALRSQIAAGAVVTQLDPQTLDPSPYADRLIEPDDPGFAALKASIAARGQEIPVLVRPLPGAPGRYQIAYGHRRARAARDLGKPVKAIVQDLDDAALVLAQGVENAARQDLSFIERALFAMRLEDAGHPRSMIQQALAIDRAEASKLIAVARAVPTDLVVAIGPAGKVGRGRWQAFADRLLAPGAVDAARAALAADGASQSDARFLVAFRALAAERPAPSADASGVEVRRIAGGEMQLVFPPAQKAFAAFVAAQLPKLSRAFLQGAAGDETQE